MTMDKVMQELHRLSVMVGDEFDIPVSINKRLTRTLGRVHCECHNDVWFPTSMEFSATFLESSTDESILSVIQHEWCHYYVTKDSGEHHGHDAVFKAMCARIGCTNDKTKTHVDEMLQGKSYKYNIYCPTCGKNISGYSRMCSTLRNIDACTCKTCGKGELKVIQNW